REPHGPHSSEPRPACHERGPGALGRVIEPSPGCHVAITERLPGCRRRRRAGIARRHGLPPRPARHSRPAGSHRPRRHRQARRRGGRSRQARAGRRAAGEAPGRALRGAPARGARRPPGHGHLGQGPLADPDKAWKFSAGDLQERALWERYLTAYEKLLARCSTPHAPWTAIPADRKWHRNLTVASVLVHALEDLGSRYPPPALSPAQARRLRAALGPG